MLISVSDSNDTPSSKCLMLSAIVGLICVDVDWGMNSLGGLDWALVSSTVGCAGVFGYNIGVDTIPTATSLELLGCLCISFVVAQHSCLSWHFVLRSVQYSGRHANTVLHLPWFSM